MIFHLNLKILIKYLELIIIIINNNIIFYIYGVYDETIDIIESNINNVSKMVNIYTSDPLIDKTFDLVNLIIKEDKIMH